MVKMSSEDFERTSKMIEVEKEIEEDPLELIERARAKGESYAKIGESLNISGGTVRNWDKKYIDSTKFGTEKYWEEIENVENELNQLMEEREKVPPISKLPPQLKYGVIHVREMNSSDYMALADNLGYSIDHLSESKPNDYWTDIDNLKDEVERELEAENLEEPPPLNQMSKPVQRAFEMHHNGLKGYTEVLIKLDFDVRREDFRLPDGHWDKEENTINALEPVIREYVEKENELPGWKYIREHSPKGSVKGIRNIGGLKPIFSKIFDTSEYNSKEKINVERKLETDLKDHMENHMCRGYSKSDLSDIYGVSVHTVRGWERDFGINIEKIEFENEEDLKDFIENEETVQDILEVFGGNEADFADIMSVFYGERVSRDELQNIMISPAMSEYLGQRVDPDPSLWKLVDTTAAVLPMDETGLVREIFESKALDYARDELGPKPSVDEMREFIDDIERKIDEAETEAMEAEK